MPDRCAAEPAPDPALTDFTDCFFTESDFTDPVFVKYRLGTPPCDSALTDPPLTDPPLTISFLTGIATALPTEKLLADPPGSDLGRCA